MQVSSFVAESECGSDDYGAADMARHSHALRLACRSLTRLRLSLSASPDHPMHILVVHKDPQYANSDGNGGNVMGKVTLLAECIQSILPNCTIHYNNNNSNNNNMNNIDVTQSSVDCVVTVGGDGTVLQAAWRFQNCVVPPMISFNLGTLGFLTNFQFPDNRDDLYYLLSPILLLRQNDDKELRPRILLRMRLSCRIDDSMVFSVLNEVTVERSKCGHLVILDIFVDGRLLTTVTADGLIIATPTGSTAYSLSAGGPVVHPDVPCILLTPVSPHSLSFRPILLPESAHLTVMVNPRSRSSATVCMDGGRDGVELAVGQSLHVTASEYPVPTVCRRDQTDDWFDGLTTCFKWAQL